MQTLFKDILDIEHVTGVMLLDFEGKPVFKEFKSPLSREFEEKNWAVFISVLRRINETEVVFDHCMMYTIKYKLGYLFVLMDKSASAAMVRLNCSIILPSLNRMASKTKRFGRMFRRKK